MHTKHTITIYEHNNSNTNTNSSPTTTTTTTTTKTTTTSTTTTNNNDSTNNDYDDDNEFFFAPAARRRAGRRADICFLPKFSLYYSISILHHILLMYCPCYSVPFFSLFTVRARRRSLSAAKVVRSFFLRAVLRGRL